MMCDDWCDDDGQDSWWRSETMMCSDWCDDDDDDNDDNNNNNNDVRK